MGAGDSVAEGLFAGGLAGSVAAVVGNEEVEVIFVKVGRGLGVDFLDAVHQKIYIVGV